MKPPGVGQPGRLLKEEKIEVAFDPPSIRPLHRKDRNRRGPVDDRLFARDHERNRNRSGPSYLDDCPDRPEIDDGKVATRLVPDRPGVPEVDGVFIFAPPAGLVPSV